MKTKFFFATMLIACAALVTNAQGYKDGIDFYKIGKLDDAKELLERNLSTASNKAEAYYYLGQVALDQGENALAKSYYEKGIQADAKYPFNYIGQAALELENGNIKGAETFYKLAEKCTKKNPKVAVAMAKAYFKADATKYAKQIEKLTKDAFKWNQEDPDYYIFQGDMLGVQKEWGAAAGQYDLASQRDPTNIESHVKYTNVDFFLNPKRALNSLEDLLKRVPNNALVQRELAEKYFENNDAENALKYYGIYYDNPNHFPKDEARYVQLLWLNKDYDQSIAVCDKIIANPAYPAMKFFGYRFKLYNQCDKEDWETAANTGADFFAMSDIGGMEYSVRDFSYYANALNKTNRSAEAIQAFEKAMELFPNDNTIRKQMFNIYNANKDYVNAAKLCQSIVDGGDYSTADLYNLANSYRRVASTAQDATIKQDAVTRARNAINELIQKEPNELAYMYMASQIDVLEDTNEKTGSAVNSYLRLLSAVDKNPSDANATAYYKSAYAYLGYYYMTSGDNVKAKDYFTKYLKYDPNNENLRKVVEGL